MKRNQSWNKQLCFLLWQGGLLRFANSNCHNLLHYLDQENQELNTPVGHDAQTFLEVQQSVLVSILVTCDQKIYFPPNIAAVFPHQKQRHLVGKTAIRQLKCVIDWSKK